MYVVHLDMFSDIKCITKFHGRERGASWAGDFVAIFHLGELKSRSFRSVGEDYHRTEKTNPGMVCGRKTGQEPMCMHWESPVMKDSQHTGIRNCGLLPVY